MRGQLSLINRGKGWIIKDAGMVDFYTERTVKWEDGEVVLIDQTKLPLRLQYIRCRSHVEVADAIRSMAVRGAPAIGVAAGMGLALAARNSRANSRQGLLFELGKASDLLRSTRPTAVNLPWALERVMQAARSARVGRDEVVRAVIDESVKMGEEDVGNNRTLGRWGASLIRDGETILTHCKWLV